MIEKLKKEFYKGKTFLSYAIIKIFGHAFGFIVPLLIARYFAPEEFGTYSLSIMIVYFFTALLINASQKPFIVYANEELRDTGKIQKSFTARIILVSSSVIFYILLAFLFINPLTEFAAITKHQFLYLSLAFIGIGLNYLIDSIFLSLSKQLRSALFTLTVGIISVFGIVALNISNMLSLESVFFIYFAASVLASLLAVPWIEWKKLFPLMFDGEMLGKMFDYSKWMMLGGTAVYIIAWGDNLVLRYFVSLGDIGKYNLGYQIFKGTLILFGIIKMYFLPFLSKNSNNSEKIKQYLSKKRPILFLLGVAGIMVIFFEIEPFFNFVYGDRYTESIIVLRILLIASFFALYQAGNRVQHIILECNTEILCNVGFLSYYKENR